MTSRVLYVDPVGGAAGDMLLAGLIDAGASEKAVQEAVDSVLHDRACLRTEVVRRAGLRARLLIVDSAPGIHHESRSFAQIIELLESASISESVRDVAQLVFHRLAEAEAKVHGVELGEVRFGQLGDDDTVLDVVGIAAALTDLSVEKIIVSSLPMSVSIMPDIYHGLLPLPAPATLELLKGFNICEGGVGERVTPTAAAVFATLGRTGRACPNMTIERIGYGAGTQDEEKLPNLLRLWLGTEVSDNSERSPDKTELTVLETNLDDLSPELVADAFEAIRMAGALDVWSTSALMKKGRPAIVLSALCSPALETGIVRVFFETTSTLGVRSYKVRRSELERSWIEVPTNRGPVRVKVGSLDGQVITVKPEHDDVVALARQSSRAVRDVYDEVAANARQVLTERKKWRATPPLSRSGSRDDQPEVL
jgi:uncharacterized protein (TIGR00299 family) protein